MTSDSSTVIERLHAIVADAATDPMTPGVIATVQAPRLGVDWSVAAAGPKAGGARPLVDQPFRIASTTKLHVSTAVMRLAEMGQVALDDTLEGLTARDTLATLRSAGYEPGRISLFHLLSHTSGLRDHIAQASYVEAVAAEPRRRWSRAEQLEIMAAAGRPLASPGALYQYSDTGYVLLGEILERATGEALGPAVRRLARFDRAGQTSTWWEIDEAPASSAPLASQFYVDQEFTDAAPHFDLYGGGGLVSTVGDLARFARALLQGEIFDTAGALPAMLLAPPADRVAGSMMHGAGPMVIGLGDGWGWGHAGFWGCLTAHAADRDLTIAATINQPRPHTPNLLYKLVADLGGALKPR